MGLFNFIQKAVKPVGGNAFFESFGVPSATTTTDQINSYKGVVYACASAIAEEVAKIEIKLRQGENEIEKSPLFDLLENPNPEQGLTRFSLFELTQTYIELTGESFWYLAKGEITKLPKQIFILRPDKMKVSIGKNGAVAGYTFRKEDGTDVPFEVDEILHIKMPNPINPYRGMGTVQAGMVYIQTEKYASEWTRNSFYNDASPRGVLSLKGTITEQQFNDIKRKWDKEYKGISNANKTAVLKAIDVDYTKIGVGLGEVALKELRGMSRDDIMFMFRVSKPILGIVEDVNYANAKSSNYIFMQRVVKPKMARIVDAMQSALGEMYGVEIDFEDPVEEDGIEKATYFEKLLNVGLTINEIREDLGKDPIDGGDTIYQPVNFYPVGSVAPQEMKLIKRIKKTKKKDAEKQEVKQEIVGNKLDKKYIHWKSFNSIEQMWLRKIQSSIDKVLLMQKKEVLAKLTPKRKKDVTGYEPDIEKYKAIWNLTLDPILLALVKEEGEYAAGIVGTEFTVTKQIEDALSARVTKVFSDFDAETSAKLTESMLQGITSEESLADLAKRIDAVYGEAMGYRSDRIARTETHRTGNLGSTEAYKQSKVVTGKEWYAQPGACPYCQEMNGVVVELNDNFLELGSSVSYTDAEDIVHSMGISYEPIGTADLHPNCECTQLPWSQEYDDTGHFVSGDDNETIV